MDVVYRLTPELRTRLKDPLGRLIEGSFSETMSRFKEFESEKRSRLIVSVGDTVTKNLLECGLTPRLSVVDNLAMRKRTEPIRQGADRTIGVENPHGTITAEAMEAIGKSFSREANTRIIVEGEEDLLTLIAILCAPLSSVVVYGQPHKGIVVVDVTEQKKAEVKAILNEMKVGKLNKKACYQLNNHA